MQGMGMLSSRGVKLDPRDARRDRVLNENEKYQELYDCYRHWKAVCSLGPIEARLRNFHYAYGRQRQFRALRGR